MLMKLGEENQEELDIENLTCSLTYDMILDDDIG